MASKTIPGLILAFCGILMIAERFFNVPVFRTMAGEIRTWGIIISAFALGLASVNLARYHGLRVSKRSPGWFHSAACLISMAAFAIAGMTIGPRAPLYSFYFANLHAPLGVAVIGLTIFFIATAGLRAITIRNVEGGILLGSALIIMLANIPLGTAISRYIPEVADYINRVPNMAGQRGILITGAIGSIAFGLRVLVGLERTQFGGDG